MKSWNDQHAQASDKGFLRRKREAYLVAQIIAGIDEWRKYPALVRKLTEMAQRSAAPKRDSLNELQLMLFGKIYHSQPESQPAL